MTTKEQSSISAQEVPKVKLALEEKYKAEPKKEIPTEAAQLPQPTGWRILVLPFKMKEKTEGGVLLGQETLERQQWHLNVGMYLLWALSAIGIKNVILRVLGARSVTG